MPSLILIPARSGSTRVINKNILSLKDKPLVAHAIHNALNSKSGRVVVTTNSKEIADIAEKFGAEVPFMRPPELSTSTASSLSAILHALLWFRENEDWIPDMIAFMPPTNPFVQPVTIRNMFRLIHENLRSNSIVSITKPKTHPFRIVKQFEDGTIQNGIIAIDGKTINDLERSQDWPVVWEGSPACRLTRTKFFYDMVGSQDDLLKIEGKTYDVHNCLGYEISEREAFDIDNSDDFKMARILATMV